MPNDRKKHDEIESQVYDEFLSTELYDDQDHEQDCDNNRIRPRRTLLTIFLAIFTLSVILLIYQTQDQLFAKSSHSSFSSFSTTPSLSSSESKKGSSNEGSHDNNTNSETSDSNHLGSVDPTHCDQPGYPSCYSVGYSDGQNSAGTSCPTGHSTEFCKGWNAGSQSEVSNRSSSNSPQSNNSSANTNQTNISGKGSIDIGAEVTHHKLRSTVKHSSEANLNQQSQTNTNANIINSSSSHINSKSNIRNNAHVSSNLLNFSSSHKSRSHNSLSLTRNNKANINQTGPTITGNNITNSPSSAGNSKPNINNTTKVISNLNSPSTFTPHTTNTNPSFIKQKSNLKIDQAGQTNDDVNVTNSPNSHVKDESSISNGANVNSNNPTKYAGITSSSPSTSITQNSKNTINQGAQDDANINVNNSPGTHIVNEQTIKQSVRINNEVNNIIKNNAVNKIVQENSPSCPQLTDIMTLKLGNSSMSSGALFPLADVAPYRLIGGHLTANLPSSSQQNIVVAQVADNGVVKHAVILDLNQITGSNLNQNSLYETNLGSDISGTNPFTGNQDEVSSITNLFLWNNNQQTIAFDDANGVTIDLIYK